MSNRCKRRRKIDRVMVYIWAHPGCSRSEIAEGCCISYGQVVRYCRDLTGSARAIGERFTGVWRLWPTCPDRGAVDIGAVMEDVVAQVNAGALDGPGVHCTAKVTRRGEA